MEVPAAEKVAVVSTAAASPKVTSPGPLRLAQAVISVPPAGCSSSVAVPLMEAVAGRVIVTSGPASDLRWLICRGLHYIDIVTGGKRCRHWP